MKLRFRVVSSNDRDYPFGIEQKFLCFWIRKVSARTQFDANEYIKDKIKEKIEKNKAKVIISEYSEDDYLVDKLKGKNV